MTSILFESWRGAYADNPRAISEFLQRRHPELTQYWVIDDPASLPPGVRPVKRHSPRYFALLLTVDILIANDIITKHLIKGPRTRYLQTWHGTPLKTLANDEPRIRSGDISAHHKRVMRDVPKWDALLSPSSEISQIFRRAFAYEGPILETGSPRNDVLLSPDAPAIRSTARKRLGLDEDTVAVLYAPTWRDYRPASGRGFEDPGGLDLDVFLSATPDHVNLLLKMHPNVVTRLDGRTERVTDVSHIRETSELILAADVLVSDYSSVVFDFAVTRKPILLFPYDLDAYRRARGFYFDYHEWAPGPVVTTTDDLSAEVTRALEIDLGRTSRYEEFLDRFCPMEDGKATQRVYEQFLAPLLG